MHLMQRRELHEMHEMHEIILGHFEQTEVLCKSKQLDTAYVKLFYHEFALIKTLPSNYN